MQRLREKTLPGVPAPGGFDAGKCVGGFVDFSQSIYSTRQDVYESANEKAGNFAAWRAESRGCKSAGSGQARCRGTATAGDCRAVKHGRAGGDADANSSEFACGIRTTERRGSAVFDRRDGASLLDRTSRRHAAWRDAFARRERHASDARGSSNADRFRACREESSTEKAGEVFVFESRRASEQVVVSPGGVF